MLLKDTFSSKSDGMPDFSLAKKAIEWPLVIFWSSGTTGRPKGIAHGINFFLRSLVKSAFPPATLLQTVHTYVDCGNMDFEDIMGGRGSKLSISCFKVQL